MDNRDQNVKVKRQRMSRQQRAKQFAPFQAVGGLSEALRKKEEEHLASLLGNCYTFCDKESDRGSDD